jgi:hypothetical protein
MKVKQSILKSLAIASMTLITTTTAFAHSDHDHSKVPFNWQFTQKLYSKVERSLTSAKPSGVIGLNPVEQKNFNHYGIKVGNKFSSIVRNVDVTFERTSAGIKIVDASVFGTPSNENILPLRKVSKVSKVSLRKPFHIGHDHKRLPVEWSFGDSTNAKIVKHMFDRKGRLSVGLTSLEKNLLTEYGIKPGNKFQLSISGHSFLAEKTSSGIIILNHVEKANLAKAELSKNMVEDNI